MPRRRRAGSLALLFAIAVAVLAAAWFGQTALVFPAPARGREPPYPDRLVRIPEATFLYFPGKRVVAYFHGNGEDLADSVPMISLLRTLGVGVLAVEYPGYGMAGGRHSEEGMYSAGQAALDWVRAESGIEPDRVTLLGQSLGTAVATEMARRGLGGRLVLISPFTSVPEMVRRLIPFFPARFVRYRFDNASKAQAISLPVLIVHGAEDDVVPFAMGERLAATFPQARLVAIQEAHHNDLLTLHAIEVREALAPFLKL